MSEISSFNYEDYFCRVCGNLLALGQSSFAKNAGVSSTRPYHHCCLLCQTQTKRGTRPDFCVPKRKFPDKSDIISEEAAWANAAKADEKCPKCDHPRAYYLQVQTRSADEPMTTFYRCENCSNTWKE